MRPINNLPDKIWDYIKEKTDFEYYERANNRIGVKEVTTCLRKAYYLRQYKDYFFDDDTKWIIFRGMVFDDIFSKLYAQNSVKLVHKEPNMHNGCAYNVEIVGKIDFIDDDGEIWELKTVNSIWSIKNGYRKEHYLQANFYAYMMGKDTFNLLYVSFDGIKAFRDIPMCPKDAQYIIERAVALSEHLEDKTIPPKEESKSCKYCPYIHICMRDGNEPESNEDKD